MFFVYVLYSNTSGRNYCGYSNDVARRVYEHNVTETKGYTLRYRPWVLIHTEDFDDKKSAMSREKYLKTGKGREEIKLIIERYLKNGTVSPVLRSARYPKRPRFG